MGLEIDRAEFTDEDHARFDRRLYRCLHALSELLARPGFGVGPTTIGAEVELDLVDADGRPAPINREVLAETRDPRVTHEVDRFNVEVNSCPLALAGRPFTALADELGDALQEVGRAAALHGARTIAIGILPTLREADLHGALTERNRYRALSAALRRLRPDGFSLHIEGEDALAIVVDDVTFEGANTSFQLHLRIDPDAFAAHYNAAQLAMAPALAVAGNSPLFLGRRLWDETRIALFRQSVDDREGACADDWRPARVSFGHGWVRRSALELFAESVSLHAPLLPVLGPQDPDEVLRSGGVPELAELRLHHGTVWRWNRAVFDATAGGHLRIEMRALPSGPTVADMVANAAFGTGLVFAFAGDIDPMLAGLTFGHARRNFYDAARFGLDARLLWPDRPGARAREVDARDLVTRLLPVAHAGLCSHGVDAAEADAWLAIIEARATLGRTGARWQRAWHAALGGGEGECALVERYLQEAATGRPVHTWTLP